MGANTSTAMRSASMNNPSCPETIILISDEVASRIDGNRRELQEPIHNAPTTPTEPYICNKCIAEKEKEEKMALKPKTPAPLNTFEQQSKAIEKEEFEKTLQMLDKKIGKPTDWKKEHEEEIKNLQSDLLKCYKDYPNDPLRCYKNAKNYQDFVFEKQYKTILKQTLGAGDGNEK